jgi:hypothetical protein
MKLHEAIKKLLIEFGRPMTTNEIAEELNNNRWYVKQDGSKITGFQIHGRTKSSGSYSHLFKRNGLHVSLVSLEEGSSNPSPGKNLIYKSRDKDEDYVVDLCDKVLGLKSSRQHGFDFLVGDPGKNGKCKKLPVDAYYKELNLVIEYREKQHTESVDHFDKPNKLTVSGVHRGEQRKIYDERRRQVLPEYNIRLVEISYSDFKHNNKKRIIRDDDFDKSVIEQKLKEFIK